LIPVNVPFFLRSGLPFFTVAKTMFPGHAAGSLFSFACVPCTDMMYKFLAPLLSAQLTTAPTGYLYSNDVSNVLVVYSNVYIVPDQESFCISAR